MCVVSTLDFLTDVMCVLYGLVRDTVQVMDAIEVVGRDTFKEGEG